jgi:hypothetical protein
MWYTTARDAKPTRPALPRLVMIPVIVPITSPPMNGTFPPKITCKTIARAINATPASVADLIHPHNFIYHIFLLYLRFVSIDKYKIIPDFHNLSILKFLRW